MKKIVFLSALLGVFCTISAQNTFPTTGNVGVGVTSPLKKLVVDSGNVSDIVSFQNINGSIVFSYTTGLGSMDLGASQAFRIRQGSNIPFYLSSSGNVGIGTTSPVVALDVSGSIKATGNLNASKGYFEDTSDAQIVLRSTDAWNGIDFQDGSGGRDFLWYNGQHKTFSIGGGGSNVANKKLHIEGGTSIGTGYRNSSIPVNGLAIEGNVGIGTTTPTEKLHIKGNLLLEAYKILGNEQGIFFREGFNTSSNKYNLSILAFDHSSTAISPDGLSINANDGVSFSTGSNSRNERMRISRNGNVGIGTINPTEKLHIEGNINMVGSNRRIYLGGPGGTTFGIGYSTQYPDYGIFYTEGSPDFVSISPNGNATNGILNVYGDGKVGIGTNTPDEKMVVQVTDTYRHVKYKAPNGEERFQFYVGGTGNGAWMSMYDSDGTSRNVQIQASNGGNTYFNAGNVGIGTSSPQTELDVKGIIKSTDGIGNTLFLTSSTTGSYIRVFGNQNFNLRDTGGSSKFNFNLSSGDANFNGALGVGNVQVPSNYKLAVGGKIIAEEVKVKLQSSGWPDYVFTKEYDLMSVKEVEAYIKKNGHLPKMPSAKKVEKEGIFLGEMNKKLLEKVEELTLYTISQEKKIGNQEQKLSKQEKLINELLKRVEKLEKN